MLLASSHQMPIHGEVILSCNCEAARLKQSDITLIELSGVLEIMGVSGLPLAVFGGFLMSLIGPIGPIGPIVRPLLVFAAEPPRNVQASNRIEGEDQDENEKNLKPPTPTLQYR